MAKHDIKGDKLQINRILSKEEQRIIVENIMTYTQGFTLDDFDLVYKKYVDDLFAEFEGGGGEGSSSGGLIDVGVVTQDVNDLILSELWRWKINGGIYEHTEEETFSIPVPDTGFTRIDLIVGDVNGDFVFVQGTQSEEVAVAPNLPDDTVPLVQIFSNDNGVQSFEEFAISSFVRFDINSQNLSALQRLNARTNMQAVSKDTNDERVGSLIQRGLLNVIGDYIQTVSNGTSSANAWQFSNPLGGGAAFRRSGGLTVVSRGDSTTDYLIFRGINNQGTEVFRVRQSGATKGGDAINEDDFVTLRQLNGEIAQGITTRMSPDDFYLGKVLETVEGEEVLVDVLYKKGPKDEVISDSGTLIIDLPQMKNLVFTRQATVVGVRYANDDNEWSGVNRSGVPLTFSNTGTEANTQFLETHIFQDGEKFTFKSIGGYWILTQNKEVAFSDKINSVKANKSIGPDGLEIITGVYDKNTGEQLIFKEYPSTPDIIDGVVFVFIDGKYFKRPTPNGVFVDWYGAKNDGTDESIPIQKAMDMAGFLRSEIHFSPKLEYVGANIQARSYTTINLNGALLKLIPDAPSLTPILSYFQVENVNTINAVLDGQKDLQTIDHIGQPQQGGLHGIRIYGCKDLIFRDVKLNNNYIDGIYIRGSTLVQSTSNAPENIRFERVYCDGNMRQGVSIIGGKKIKFFDCDFLNTEGIRPEAGIDMEPNYPWEGFEDIDFDKCRIKGNHGRCLSVNLKDFGTPGQGGFLNNVTFNNCLFDRLDNADIEVVRLTGVGTMDELKFTNNTFINGKFSFGLPTLQINSLDLKGNKFFHADIEGDRINDLTIHDNRFFNNGFDGNSINLTALFSNTKITKNIIYGSNEAIRIAATGTLDDLFDGRIDGNEIYSPELFGIRLYKSNGFSVSKNKIKGLPTGTAISLNVSSENNVIDNRIDGCDKGIVLNSTSERNRVLINNITDTTSEIENTGVNNIIDKNNKLTKSVSDSDYTVLPIDEIIELSSITADRTLTFPLGTRSSLKRIIVINNNLNSFSWLVSSNILDFEGNTITSIENKSVIEVVPSGANWKIVSEYKGQYGDINNITSTDSGALLLELDDNYKTTVITFQTSPVDLRGLSSLTSQSLITIINDTDSPIEITDQYVSATVKFDIGGDTVIPVNTFQQFAIVGDSIIKANAFNGSILEDYAVTANTYTKEQVDTGLTDLEASLQSDITTALTNHYSKTETYDKDEIDAIATSSYMGYAVPSTVPNEALGPQSYSASENGIYPDFGGIEVDLSLGKHELSFDGTSWKKIIIPFNAVPVDQTTDITPQKIDVSSKLRAGRPNEDGTFSTSTSWLSIDYTPVTAGVTYIISGVGGFPTTAPRIIYKNISDAVIGQVSGLGVNNSNDVIFTPPAGAVKAAFGVTSGTGVGTNPLTSPYQKTVMLNEGETPLPFIGFGYGLKEERLIKSRYSIVYVSLFGVDTNKGTSEAFAVRKISKAKELVDKGGTIVVLEGDYFDEDFTLDGLDGISLRGQQADRVRFIYGTRITSATLTSGQTRVYQVAYATALTTTIFLWQHDIEDVNTEIGIDERHPLHQGRSHRLGSTRLYYASSIAEIESTTDKLMWYQSGGILYFSKTLGSDLVDNPIVIPTTSQVTATRPQKLNISNISILYRPLKTIGCVGRISHTQVGYVNISGCIVYDETIDLEFDRVETMACINDGFSGHGYVSPNFDEVQVTKARFKDCYSHDNGDDGTSNHEYCEEIITGGLYEYNGNGVTPAVGAHTVCYHVMTRKNGDHPWTNDKAGTGFSAQGNPTDGGVSTSIVCYNCISIGDRVGFSGLDNSSKYIKCIAKDSIVTPFGTGEQIACDII